MTELQDMRYFVEVLEQGGFNRAAERLGVSKSIVSRRIAAMEADLGAQLVNRTTRGVSATEAGAEFKLRCERILSEYNEAREAVARERSEVVGRLRISAPLAFGVRHVSPVLTALGERHPRLEIDASFSDRIVDVLGERFDAAIRIGTLPDSNLIARRVSSIRALVLASPAYLDRKGRPRTPADLADHDCLIYSGSASRDWTFQVGRKLVAVRPKGRLSSDNGEVLVRWAAAGMGIVNVPSFLAGSELEDGRLESVLAENAAPEYGVYVVRPPGEAASAKVRALIDSLIAHFNA